MGFVMKGLALDIFPIEGETWMKRNCTFF
jgi:hypothetical protein